nr:unnamed protein product [Callosobruchus analis]
MREYIDLGHIEKVTKQENAFGACVYGKSTDSEGNSVVSLLVAKGKVAPLKTITLPSLELCGALLAAKLANNTSKALKLDNVKRFFWCDSTIVLAWLKTPPSKLKTFVSNRVSEVQETTGLDTWKHIPSTLNPADLISRGMKPSDIHSAKIWWHGPEFLKHSEAEWPINPCEAVNDLPDIKKNCTIFLVSKSERLELFDKYSNLARLKRVTALLLRFIQNCKQPKENRTFGPLASSEVRLSSDKLIKIQIKQHIWQRWCKEYVSELQQRIKWKRTQGSLQQGALVLIKEDNVPPMNWKLGRVVNLHQGKDGVNRVATVNTQSGLLKRSFAKLCPLPIDSNIVYTCD